MSNNTVISVHLKKTAVAGFILCVMPMVYAMAAVHPAVKYTSVVLKAVGLAAVSSPIQQPDASPIAPKAQKGVSSSLLAEQRRSDTPENQDGILKSIKIDGSSFPPSLLESKFKVVRVGSRVFPSMAEYDIEMNLKSFLKENGYMQAEIQWNLVPLEENKFELQLHIEDGVQYKLGNLKVDGFTVFKPEEIYSQFNMQEGDILNYGKIKSALETIRNMYADRGYLKWNYIPVLNIDAANRSISTAYTFYEGIQFRVGYVRFVGCKDQVQEYGLMAMVDFHPGDVFSGLKGKAVFAELGKYGIAKVNVEIIDESRGLVGVTFTLQSAP